MRTFKEFFIRPSVWFFVLVGVGAFFIFFNTYVKVYSPLFGITKFIRFGYEFEDRGLAVFKVTPKDIDSPWGFDGQFYAQLALDPLLRDPQLKVALDSPAYRSRRILMPWLAWLGGFGRPFWILNVYAALNLVFWVGFAVIAGHLFRPYGWGGLAGFAGTIMTCGIIESLRCSLTDFPAFVFMTLAMVVGGVGGAGILAFSALAREPNIIGIVGLWNYRRPWLATAKHNLILGLIAGLPIALWCAYVISRFASSVELLTSGNLTWPLQGIMMKLGEISVDALNGGIDWNKWCTELYSNKVLHALLTIVSTLTQCTFLLTHREWSNRIWRMGAIFIPYFLCISFISWEDHFTVTRHGMPLALAFNLILAMNARRSWIIWFVLGNCFIPYGVYQFAVVEPASPPVEYRIVASDSSGTFVRLRFDQGWANEEWHRDHTWRWSVARHATLSLVNPATHPVTASLAFTVSSIAVRDFKVRLRGTDLWSTPSLQSEVSVATPQFLLPSGETIIEFDTSTDPVRPASPGDTRVLSFSVLDLQIILPSPFSRSEHGRKPL